MTNAIPVDSPPEKTMAVHTHPSTAAQSTVDRYGVPMPTRNGSATRIPRNVAAVGVTSWTTALLYAVYPPHSMAARTMSPLPSSDPAPTAIWPDPAATTAAVPNRESSSPTQADFRSTSTPEIRPHNAVHSGALAMMRAALPAVV